MSPQEDRECVLARIAELRNGSQPMFAQGLPHHALLQQTVVASGAPPPVTRRTTTGHCSITANSSAACSRLSREAIRFVLLLRRCERETQQALGVQVAKKAKEDVSLADR